MRRGRAPRCTSSARASRAPRARARCGRAVRQARRARDELPRASLGELAPAGTGRTVRLDGVAVLALADLDDTHAEAIRECAARRRRHHRHGRARRDLHAVVETAQRGARLPREPLRACPRSIARSAAGTLAVARTLALAAADAEPDARDDRPVAGRRRPAGRVRDPAGRLRGTDASTRSSTAARSRASCRRCSIRASCSTARS